MAPALPLVLHIPHDSTVIPERERRELLLGGAELAAEILAMTDMHTAALYDLPGAARVVFPVSRLVVDPERFSDDAQEPMAALGMGVIYTKTANLKPLRPPLPPARRRELLNEHYFPHHARLEAAVEAALAASGYCVIADAHSFPSRPLPYEQKPGRRPEICLGTDDFHTPPGLVQALLRFFAARGYDTALDTPFAGALVPLRHYRRDKRVYSVMIETRRDLYMNEGTGEKAEGFAAVAADLRGALALMAEFSAGAGQGVLLGGQHQL